MSLAAEALVNSSNRSKINHRGSKSHALIVSAPNDTARWIPLKFFLHGESADLITQLRSGRCLIKRYNRNQPPKRKSPFNFVAVFRVFRFVYRATILSSLFHRHRDPTNATRFIQLLSLHAVPCLRALVSQPAWDRSPSSLTLVSKRVVVFWTFPVTVSLNQLIRRLSAATAAEVFLILDDYGLSFLRSSTRTR